MFGKIYNDSMRPVNPYIVGNPIKDKANFFGRQDIFREVLQVLRQRESNAIVLYGQRRIGKTSVLLQLEKELANGGEFTPVYFDLQDKAAKTLAEVLYELSQRISKVIGHTGPDFSSFDERGDYFRDVFLQEITGKVAAGGLVLLFDEFDVLDSPLQTQASEAFFPYLRAWMTDIRRVKFVFVIGRRPEDLSVRTMSTFKGIQSTRVSFLSKDDAECVVRQSEEDHSLQWEQAAVDRVLDLTHGHPYFTQLLCSVVWENARDAITSETPLITTSSADSAVMQALKFGANAFSWIWDGLPPAERVVAAAMAEVQEEIITQEKLIETLNQSGVRLVARELEFAPETLIDWEVLIASDGAYRFAIPLLRRWVLINRPLRRVKEELDRLDPLADTLFQGGQGFYRNNNPDAAEQQLRQALNINPNHLKARLLLGQILLEKGNLTESVNMFDAAYQYDERSARAHLIKSLLALAETQPESLKLATYERILNIQSDQPLAKEKMHAIWISRGEAAQSQGNYEEALKCFEQIEDTERITKVRALLYEKKLAMDMQRADVYEKSGQWKSALDVLTELIVEYPENGTLQSQQAIARANWRSENLKRLDALETEENWEQIAILCEDLLKDFPEDAEINGYAQRNRLQIDVARKFHEAENALQTGQNNQARQLYSAVLVEDPTHLPAAIKLIEATYGKVSIRSHVPLVIHVIAIIISIAWTLNILFATSGMIADRLASYYMGIYSTNWFFFRETFILMGIILTPLIGVLLGFYVNSVINIAYKIKPQKSSYVKAFWTHLLIGLGLFYADRNLRRKWVYPFLALIVSFLIFSRIFYELTRAMYIGNFRFKTMGEGSVENTVETIFGVLVGLYIISFVDVFITCYIQRVAYPGYGKTLRETSSVLPKGSSDRQKIPESTIILVKKLLQGFDTTLHKGIRWLKPLTVPKLFGLITLLIVPTFILYIVTIINELAAVFLLLAFAWVIVAIILVLQFAAKLINWLIARYRKRDIPSVKEKPDSASNITK